MWLRAFTTPDVLLLSDLVGCCITRVLGGMVCVAPWVKGVVLGTIGVVFTTLRVGYATVMHRIITSVDNV